jgi:hypothetical protein
MAKSADDLKGLSVNNDKDLSAAIEKKFPKPVLTYKFGKEKIEREVAAALIKRAKTAEDLKDLAITNDQELLDEIAKKFPKATEAPVAETVTEEVPAEAVLPVAEEVDPLGDIVFQYTQPGVPEMNLAGVDVYKAGGVEFSVIGRADIKAILAAKEAAEQKATPAPQTEKKAARPRVKKEKRPLLLQQK